MAGSFPQNGFTLHLLPVDKIEGKFSEDTGRPTKELYSVCCLSLMMEYYGIKLIAPAPPQPEGKVGLSECKFDEGHKIVECPAGNKPISKSFKNGKGRAVFFASVCDKCPLKDKCRSRKCGKQNREFKYNESDLRPIHRRKIEATDEFKRDYGHKRCPIEGLNGRL